MRFIYSWRISSAERIPPFSSGEVLVAGSFIFVNATYVKHSLMTLG